MLQKLVLLGIAGALGTLARYASCAWVQRTAPGGFPWATLAVNAAGCFVAGLFWAYSEPRAHLGGETRNLFLIGFMGAFTTFSSFMLETSAMVRNAAWAGALGNVALQNVAGASALFAGLFIGALL